MTEDPSFTIREYRPGEEVEILAAFNRVFAEVDPGFQARSLAEWRWEFVDNPGGAHVLVAATPEGRIVGHYAGIVQPMRLDGEPGRFSHALDSFVDPGFRRGLKRPGLFARMVFVYVDSWNGPPPVGDTFQWGMPIPIAYRIGNRLKGFQDVRRDLPLVEGADPNRVQLNNPVHYRFVRQQTKLEGLLERIELGDAGGIEVEEVERFPDGVRAPVAAMIAERPAILDRTPEYLDWRFCRHPHRKYRIALARRGGSLVGYAVYRSAGLEGEEGGVLCDWIVPGADGAVSHALRAWAVACARAEGQERIFTMVPDTQPEWLDFQHAGFRVRDTCYTTVGRSVVKRYTNRWLYRNWYYTLTDTDLV